MYGIVVTDVADAAAVRVGTASKPAAASSVADIVAESFVGDGVAFDCGVFPAAAAGGGGSGSVGGGGGGGGGGGNDSIIITLLVAVPLEVQCSEDTLCEIMANLVTKRVLGGLTGDLALAITRPSEHL